jgi:hypothetical protein
MRPSIYSEEPDIDDTWPHGEMVDMAYDPEEIREKQERMLPGLPPMRTPQYPCGLSISLTDDELEKLGLDMNDCGDGTPLSVGCIFEFFATAKVTSAQMTQNIDSAGVPQKCCRVELQIVGMLPHDIESPEIDRVEEEQARGEARRRRFYDGNGVPSYDED